MYQTASHAIVESAIAIRRSHPEMQALSVLDLVLGDGQATLHSLDEAAMHPASDLGSLIAEAFDPLMSPSEWAAWAGEGSEALIQDALLKVWREEIIPRLDARYSVALH